MQTDPPARHHLLGPFQRVCYLVQPGAPTHRSDGGELRQLHTHCPRIMRPLGDLEQQPEAIVTSAFVMLLGSPAVMEAAAARGSHRGQPNELAFLDGAERPALTFLPHRAFRTCPAERPDERRVPYASPVAIHLPVPQS
jgi:hypothetical protein